MPTAAIAAIAGCLLSRGAAPRLLKLLLNLLARASRHSLVCGLAIGALAFLLSVAMTLSTRWPAPGIHDEFSYLLAADTFAHGSLTNPMHPMWEHLETFHEIMQPTYASKYPPAQGMLLALGQVLTGRPIVGAWIGNALACMAIYWALLAWLPRRWALPGGLLATVHPLVLEWGQCFWGGAAATMGGAIVAGSFRRITRTRSTRPVDAALLGVGLAILANSRPFEGFVLGVMIAVALAVWFRKRAIFAPPAAGASPGVKQQSPVGIFSGLTLRLVVPLCGVLGITALWMGYYNYRVSGDPLKLPYSIHEKTYAMTPLLIWQKPGPEPEYHHKAMKDFWTGWALEFYKRQQSLKGWAFDCGRKLWTFSRAYLWQFVMVIPTFMGAMAARRNGKARFALVMIGGYLAVLMNLSWPLQPHYAGPFFVFVLLLQMQGLRCLRHWKSRQFLSADAVLLGLIITCAVSPALYWNHHRSHLEGNLQRLEMINQLKSQGGHHLVVVRYDEKHAPHDEWVYNDADIPNSPVVWARDMGRERNRELLSHFERRTAWLLEADQKPRKLVPYHD